MALTLATAADLAVDATFQKRVAMAFYVVARNVLSEPVGTDGHEVRVQFARSIILNDSSRFLQYAAMVASNASIYAGGPYLATSSQPADDQITAAVSSMWNWLAGVLGARTG